WPPHLYEEPEKSRISPAAVSTAVFGQRVLPLRRNQLWRDLEILARDPAGARANVYPSIRRTRSRGQFFQWGAIHQCAVQRLAAGFCQRTDRRRSAARRIQQ